MRGVWAGGGNGLTACNGLAASVALGMARHCPPAAGKGGQALTSTACGGGQAQPGKAHLCQCWSLLSTAGLPTTISRALALVMATLSL